MSCWDTDTDINGTDDESNGFLFANVDGDSASVICVDDGQAMELIKRWKAKELKCEPVDKESSTKPGSDGTYEVVDGEDHEVPPEEHIYESIEDCTPEYQMFVGNENTSPINTPTHVTVTQRRKSLSPVSKTKRSNSLPTSSGSSPKFARKYSDCTEYTRLRRRQSDTRTGLPPPLPPPNTTNNDYAQLFRLSGKVSPPNDSGDKGHSPPPSMILKHKGKSYVLPIADKGKVNRDKIRRQSSSQTTPKHSVSSSTSSNNLHPITSTDIQSPQHRYPVPRSVSMGFQGSTKPQTNPTTTSVDANATPRRKSKHNSSHSTYISAASLQTNKSHVTLYGVL